MLIVAGKLTVDPADVQALSEAASAMMTATREEPGCIEYVFSVSVADPGTVQIYEIWESDEDLKKHFVMPHMVEFQAAIKDLAITGRDLAKYEIASSEPL